MGYCWCPATVLLLSCVVMLMTLTVPVTSTVENTVWHDILKEAPPIQYSTLSGPSFINNTDRTVRVVSGTTAMLPCAIRNLHNYTVSWVRGSDIRLLTTSSITYTSDKRFVAVNPAGGEQWILKIHYVRKSDAGSYICQVSTTPPISHNVNLTVQEAVVSIEPGREVYVQSGSGLELICQVQGCPAPAILAWNRSGQPIMTPQPNDFQVTDQNVTKPVSRLTFSLSHAKHSDSGIYTCTSTCTKPLNVTVYVLKGEELAAMQHHNGTSPLHTLPGGLLWSLLASTMLLLLTRTWTQSLFKLPMDREMST